MNRLVQQFALLACSALCCCLSGCNFIPDVRHKPQFHNPFPQIRTVAVLPFRNQSESPTLSGDRITLAYSHELQAVPGFEVLPVGAVRNQLSLYEKQQNRPLMTAEDFQKFAQYLGVDAVIQGSVTDYDPYYPPRLTLKTNWYTANPNFHSVPVGYGLPWGTKHEKRIPEWVRLEAERELASEQLVSQTPVDTPATSIPPPSIDSPAEVQVPAPDKADSVASQDGMSSSSSEVVGTSAVKTVAAQEEIRAQEQSPESMTAQAVNEVDSSGEGRDGSEDWYDVHDLPSDADTPPIALSPSVPWPDPQGFIPPLPSTTPPQPIKFTGPVISHMAAYNGTDEDFTSELEEYYYFRDDGRFGGWESYLQRSEDFIRFCCHLHIKETLVSRGGQLKNRTVVRWPFSRYQER